MGSATTKLGDTSGEKALVVKAGTGDAAGVRRLLDSKVFVNATLPDGDFALELAAMEGHVNVVALLVESAADLNQQDSGGISALHAAVHERRTEVVNFLINARANPNVVNNEGDTPLLIAAKQRDDEMVRLLWKNGGRLETANAKGERVRDFLPLFFARLSGSFSGSFSVTSSPPAASPVRNPASASLPSVSASEAHGGSDSDLDEDDAATPPLGLDRPVQPFPSSEPQTPVTPPINAPDAPLVGSPVRRSSREVRASPVTELEALRWLEQGPALRPVTTVQKSDNELSASTRLDSAMTNGDISANPTDPASVEMLTAEERLRLHSPLSPKLIFSSSDALDGPQPQPGSPIPRLPPPVSSPHASRSRKSS